MPVTFPSLPFFDALRAEMRRERDGFARLGYFDTTFGVRVLRDGAPPAEFTLAFEVFDCVDAREGIDPDGVDFVLEGPLAGWRAMLDTIHRMGAADTTHSLNTLTHFGETLQVRYDDPIGHDKLYRFAESMQRFFDLSARVDFVYPDGGNPPAARGAA
jgi:hypothetical protein